jgi:hypothetical protein
MDVNLPCLLAIWDSNMEWPWHVGQQHIGALNWSIFFPESHRGDIGILAQGVGRAKQLYLLRGIQYNSGRKFDC